MRLSKERTKTVYVPGDEDNGYVVIRNLSKETVARIEGDFMIVTDKGVELRNFAERESVLAKECVKDWGNMFDPGGVPLTCNLKNLELASQFVIDIEGEKKRFFEWINSEREKFAQEVEEEEKKAVKN